MSVSEEEGADHDSMAKLKELYKDLEFHDDISGAPLDTSAIITPTAKRSARGSPGSPRRRGL